MMELHVITRSGTYLLMETLDGTVISVFPAPADSMPVHVALQDVPEDTPATPRSEL